MTNKTHSYWPNLLLACLLPACGRYHSDDPSPGAGGTTSAGGQGGTTATSTSSTPATTSTSTSAATSTTAGGEGGGGGAGPDPSLGCAKQLASGRGHACILYDDGRVACVGTNDFGQLGNGTTLNSGLLVPVPLDDVQRIAAGGNRTCAATDRELYCWGDNSGSALGVATPDASPTPLSVATSEEGIEQLALGDQHGCYLDLLGHGYCWGTGDNGMVLDTPTQLGAIGLEPHDFVQLGGAVTRLLSEDRLYELTWDPNSAAAYVPVADAPSGVVENSLGINHDCVLKRSGTVWCRGNGYSEFFGVVADFGSDVVDIEVSDYFDCALTAQGQVLCRGNNVNGALGNGTLYANQTAEPVQDLDEVVEISLGEHHACARRKDGSVWCWGGLPATGVRTRPALFSEPDSPGSCDSGAPPPRPFGAPIPEATPADELADGALAWSQNLCRCLYWQPEDVATCLSDETLVLQGCLEALASDAGADALCRAENLWGAAECAAGCIGGDFPLPEDCEMGILGDTCEQSEGVYGFCQQTSLGCDGALSDTRVTQFQTCDGIADCENGFDEANCTRGAAEFTCADGSSVALDLVNDGSDDCPDGSDEWVP